jgi:transcriptional regulator with XRE-family HTH domain
MADPTELSPEVTRILNLLELLISARRVSIREVERRLNVSNGTLARLFSGKITLKYQHILDLLEILEMAPREFFRTAYSVDDPGLEKADESFRQAKALAFPDPQEPVALTRGDVQTMIEKALAAMMKPKPSKPKKPPQPPRKPGSPQGKKKG